MNTPPRLSSTNLPAGLRELKLTDEHVSAACSLSQEAGWNQTAADWRLLLELGAGFGIDDANGRLIASALALPFNGPFAWISMVLVTPVWQRRGLAQRLMRSAIETIEAQGRIPMLDATPAGRAVYRGLGFADGWALSRWTALSHNSPEPLAPTDAILRPLQARDWVAVCALDRIAFGADRTHLLQSLGERLPTVAWVAEEKNGELSGFILGRDGRNATQLGPLAAADESTACALLGAGLRATSGPIYVDALDEHAAVTRLLREAGFAIQRPFTRMARTAKNQPAGFGDPAHYFAVAGPELA